MALRPRTALVTGANRGLGEAVARGLHLLGLRVVVAARMPAAAGEAADRLGPGTVPVALDVTDPGTVHAAYRRVGPVDIVVNNAGVLLDAGARPSSVPLDLVEREIATNTLGAWRVSQVFLPDMLARGWGRIVNVSSGTGAFSNGIFVGTPGYAVSKTALNALTVVLAEEIRGSGVLVNAVNPGLVRTRMQPGAEQSPEAAAAGVIRAATLPDDGPTGTFFRGSRAIPW